MDGLLQIGYNNFYPPVIAAGVTAANALGIPTNSDPVSCLYHDFQSLISYALQDSGNSADFSLAARSVDPATGLRSTAATSYLAPILGRENLLVLTGAHVSKVSFTEGRNGELTAKSVHFVGGEGNQWSGSARAAREVILAAGACSMRVNSNGI